MQAFRERMAGWAIKRFLKRPAFGDFASGSKLDSIFSSDRQQARDAAAALWKKASSNLFYPKIDNKESAIGGTYASFLGLGKEIAALSGNGQNYRMPKSKELMAIPLQVLLAMEIERKYGVLAEKEAREFEAGVRYLYGNKIAYAKQDFANFDRMLGEITAVRSISSAYTSALLKLRNETGSLPRMPFDLDALRAGNAGPEQSQK